MKKNEQVKETNDRTILIEEMKKLSTKSSQIRFLHTNGISRGEISKILTEHYGKLVRYQHVRNVLITPIKKQK